MDFTVQFLSFFVIQTEGDDQGTKRYKHFQTLDESDYEHSEIKPFLDGEFSRICKRKVEKNPLTESAPTKIGTFVVEPGCELNTNPNFNLFHKLLIAEGKQQFVDHADDMVRMYLDTSSARGGAFIIVRAELWKLGIPMVFVMKCDFEPKIARISDEQSLIRQVDMAISLKNMKSIQYPYMPEDGMVEERELKIHQSSHARYFEDFLRYVSYEKSMPEIVNEQMMNFVQTYIEEKWQDQEHEERQQEEQKLEFWAASDKRDLQETWSHEQVVEATSRLVEHKPDLGLSFKLDEVSIKGQMAQYGENIHIAKYKGRYLVLIEGENFQFEKGISPIELLQPEDLEVLLDKIGSKPADVPEDM